MGIGQVSDLGTAGVRSQAPLGGTVGAGVRGLAGYPPRAGSGHRGRWSAGPAWRAGYPFRVR